MLVCFSSNMIRLLIFLLGFLAFATGSEKVENIDLNINFVFPDQPPKEDRTICTLDDLQTFSHAYHNCFIDKKYKDGGQDLENLVARILEQSKVCLENRTRNCRPNLKGFVAMMDQVINQLKSYSHIYLEHVKKERSKVKDFQCVEDLSISTYQSCFKNAFVEVADSSEKKFQKNVEDALSCTSKSHKSCSRSAKTSLNRMVRKILRLEQPDREEGIEDEVKPEPPKRWYDFILQPFIGMWSAIRSFFGF